MDDLVLTEEVVAAIAHAICEDVRLFVATHPCEYQRYLETSNKEMLHEVAGKD